MAAEVLMKKGKRGAAAYIQSACSSQSNLNVVNDLFDIILDPEKRIDDWDAIDWCRWLLAGGKTPDEFGQTVRRYDNATTCGLVWTANFVAYRCRTCGISPCMSLCSECFQRGNHEGHDFNMFRSQAGGACDCGDKSVMKESGFCHRHGPNSQHETPETPPDLLCVAEVFMPRLFLRLIQHLRDYHELEVHVNATHKADGLLAMLHQHSEMGAAMREVMTRALTNPQIYSNLAMTCESAKPEKVAYLTENVKAYNDALNHLPRNFTSSSGTDEKKNHTPHHATFLDELVFWTIKYEFPQKLVCLLLNMMTNQNYKEAFTITFVHHYSRIGTMLAKSVDSDTLSNRVVHVSVQLFSNEELAYRMTADFGLLHIFVDSLIGMMSQIVRQSTLQCPDKNSHMVVDCGHHIMKDHCYWPLVSDLNNVLTHRPVVLEFLNDVRLLKKWFLFLSLFQGMNMNQRELKSHVEFESTTYYAAFSVELEASAMPMWGLISHLKYAETLKQTNNVLRECEKALKQWLNDIGFTPGETINPYQVSFHLPLHRFFASFLRQAVYNQGAKLSLIIPSEEILKLIMIHPLQAQVAFHEILAGMWVRCGLQIKGQAMTYIQCHFCISLVDADLFLLQLCATHLDADWFIKTLMQMFHVWDWFTFHPDRTNSFLEHEQIFPMLEGALCCLTTLMATHTNIGLSENEATRKDMVSLLCMNDRTHSQLIDLLPDKCGYTTLNKDFELILSQVADYKAPNFEAGGTMVQGMYVPKPQVWEEEYDPIHVLLRAVHRRDYQSSLDRYTQYLRNAGKCTGSGSPWPPFRIPSTNIHPGFKDPRKILHSKTMHGLIFTILYRALNECDIPEQVLSLTIYLLDMAVQFPNTEAKKTKADEDPVLPRDVADMNFEDWFPSNDTLTNLSVVIKKIVITDKAVMSMGMVEEMEVEEEEEEMDIEVECSNYHVQSPIAEEDAISSTTVETSIPVANAPLALPPSISNTTVVHLDSSTGQRTAFVSHFVNITQQPTPGTSASSSEIPSSTSSSSSDNSQTLVALPASSSSSSSSNMAIVPTSIGLRTMLPRCLKVKHVPGRHRMLLTDKGLPQKYMQTTDTSGDSVKALPFGNKLVPEINESILSLLLALYHKLANKTDAYVPLSVRGEALKYNDSRVGSGMEFIGRLLDRISLMSADKEREIQKIVETLYPQFNEVINAKPCDSYDKEERRRRAKERQQKLMAEFASKQKAFLQKTLETDLKDPSSAEPSPKETTHMKMEYECVICGQTAISDEVRPMGMVVLLQATSVLGHSHREPPSARRLPCSDEERFHLQSEQTLAYYMENRIDQLTRHFDNKYWQLAVNIGWEGGVHVQSCGHYLHIDCHKSYMQSLKCQNQSRHQSLNVDRGEYSCPLCRQQANSVIPLNPMMDELGALVCCRANNLFDLASELSELMTSSLSERESNILKVHMHNIMEDLTNSTYSQYRSLCSPNSSSVFLFVCSIARTNLEIELVQRDSSLSPTSKQKCCFVPLLHVLSMHSRFLTQAVPTQIWTQLTGQPMADKVSSIAVLDTEVPLMLRDCVAILLQIILTLPLNMDKAYFTCIVQVLYNVVFLQSVAQLSCCLNQSQRAHWKQASLEFFQLKDEDASKMKNFVVVLGQVIHHLENSSLYLDDEDMQPSERTMEWTSESMEYYVRGICLHFLRIASLLQSHLYSEVPPLDLKDTQEEFGSLCQFLGLADSNESASSVNSSNCLNWATNEPCQLIKTWCDDYVNFVNRSVIAARNLLQKPLVWFRPALLKLPNNYEPIFQYYHRRPCSACHSVPKDPSLCLVCGTMVCLRESCCRQDAQYEAVVHSVACGAGTAMFLAVNSSTIIVIRGKRACLWGSVYLDSYGEEDRDLKRGKPLYLSQERYDLLQSQWLHHSFNHTNKRWVWHKDNL